MCIGIFSIMSLKTKLLHFTIFKLFSRKTVPSEKKNSQSITNVYSYAEHKNKKQPMFYCLQQLSNS